MSNLRELRKLYGATATFAIAYGIGNNKFAGVFKQKPRIAKKKVKKLRSVFQQAEFIMSIDRGETLTLKSKYKKGCRKGCVYAKVFHVKDKTIYCTVTKHRHESGNNRIENLTWVTSGETL